MVFRRPANSIFLRWLQNQLSSGEVAACHTLLEFSWPKEQARKVRLFSVVGLPHIMRTTFHGIPCWSPRWVTGCCRSSQCELVTRLLLSAMKVARQLLTLGLLCLPCQLLLFQSFMS